MTEFPISVGHCLVLSLCHLLSLLNFNDFLYVFKQLPILAHTIKYFCSRTTEKSLKSSDQ